MSKEVTDLSSHVSGHHFKVVNVVVSTKATEHLDVELLASRLPYSTYEPEVFPGLVQRRRNPKATIILFSTGKITSVGSKSENAARESIRTTVSEIMREIGRTIILEEMRTENVVAMSACDRRIDVEKFAEVSKESIYEPSQFPGIIYPLSGKVKVLIFASGKIVAAGSKSENEAEAALLRIHEQLQSFGCFMPG